MKKVGLLGGTGMAGHVVSTYLEEYGYDVYLTSRSAPNSAKSKAINAMDIPCLDQWLDSVGPDVVINCIGVLQKNSEQRPNVAVLLNAYLPQHLAYKYQNTRTKLIHLSTDCVFSGKRGGYFESDFADGDTYYDRSKALGEVNNNKDLTFRMSIIGPDIDPEGTGLFNWFMKQTGPVQGYTKAIWNGVTTIELARAIHSAIDQNLTGLYHLVPIHNIDKYRLLMLIKDIFEKNDIELVPYDGFTVDKTLVNTRKDFLFEVRDYPQQIKDMRTWVKTHANLYPHYHA